MTGMIEHSPLTGKLVCRIGDSLDDVTENLDVCAHVAPAPTRIDIYVELEVHIYDDPRGDDGVVEWGVWETQCTGCGRAINVVQKADKPIGRLCSVCLGRPN